MHGNFRKDDFKRRRGSATSYPFGGTSSLDELPQSHQYSFRGGRGGFRGNRGGARTGEDVQLDSGFRSDLHPFQGRGDYRGGRGGFRSGEDFQLDSGFRSDSNGFRGGRNGYRGGYRGGGARTGEDFQPDFGFRSGPPRHDGFGNVDRRHSEQPSSTPFGGGFPPHNTSRRTFDDERRNEGPKLSHQEKEATDEIRKILEKKQDEDGGCYTDDDVFSDEEDVMTTMVKKHRKEEKDENGREEEQCHDVLSDKENSGVLEAGLEKKQENASASRQVFKSGGFDSPGCQGSLLSMRSETHGPGGYRTSVQMKLDRSGSVAFGTPGGFGYSTSYSSLLDVTPRPLFNPPSIPQNGSSGFGPRRGGYDGRSSNRSHPPPCYRFVSSSVAARRDENLLRAGSSARTFCSPGSQGFGRAQNPPSLIAGTSIQKPIVPPSAVAPAPKESPPAVSTINSVKSGLGRPTEEQWSSALASFRTEEPVVTSWIAANFSATSTGPPGVNSSSEPVPPLMNPVPPAATTASVVKLDVVVHSKTSVAVLPPLEPPKTSSAAKSPVFTKEMIRNAQKEKHRYQSHSWRPSGHHGGSHGFHSPSTAASPLKPAPTASAAVKAVSSVSPSSSFGSPGGSKEPGGPAVAPPSMPTPATSTAAPQNVASAHPGGSGSGSPGGSHGFSRTTSSSTQSKTTDASTAGVKNVASAFPSSAFGSPGGSKGLGGPTVAPPSTPTPATSTAAPKNVASAHPGGPGFGSPGGSHGFGCSTSSFTQSQPSVPPSSSFGSSGGSKEPGGPAVAPPSMLAPATTTAAPQNIASAHPAGSGFGSPVGSQGFIGATVSSTQSKLTPTASNADVKNVASASSTNSFVAPPPVLKPLPTVAAASIASSSSGLVHARPSTSAGPIARPPLTPAAFLAAVGADEPDSSDVVVNGVIRDMMKNEEMRNIIKRRDPALFDQMVEYVTNAVMKNLHIKT